MPSSTSSSKPDPLYERSLPSLGASGWVALCTAMVLFAGWEAWVRSEGVTPSYRNSDGLWAEQRRRINQGEGDSWVFTGSSRTLFNLQPKVWAELDGRPPVQLALEGTSPIAVLEDLASDDDFTGTVIAGVAPGLFFSGFEYRKEATKRAVEETPTQWLGQKISVLIEPYLAFYNFDYALPAILRRQDFPKRADVESPMEVRKLADMDRDRSNRMWSRVETDEEFQQLAKVIWADGWKPLAETPLPRQKRIVEARAKQIERAVAVAEKFRSKGVQLIFVRMPAEGHYEVAEPDIAPRALAWDVLIEQTGVPGFHFEDHIEMQGYWLPEWSHMSASEADRFTETFYHFLKRELSTESNEP